MKNSIPTINYFVTCYLKAERSSSCLKKIKLFSLLGTFSAGLVARQVVGEVVLVQFGTELVGKISFRNKWDG